jgi:hypothetical protein
LVSIDIARFYGNARKNETGLKTDADCDLQALARRWLAGQIAARR